MILQYIPLLPLDPFHHILPTGTLNKLHMIKSPKTEVKSAEVSLPWCAVLHSNMQ